MLHVTDQPTYLHLYRPAVKHQQPERPVLGEGVEGDLQGSVAEQDVGRGEVEELQAGVFLKGRDRKIESCPEKTQIEGKQRKRN